MTSEELALQASGTITACLVVAVLAVVLSDMASRWVPVPTVVLEILGGILIGPAVFGLAHDNVIVEAFSQLGLTVLMFLAGYEIQMSRVAGSPLRSACAGWVGSLVLGITAGIVVVTVARPEEGESAGVLVGLIFTTTALGTVLPILRDTGDLDTRFGTFILAAGAVGEFGPILAVAVLLSGQSVVHTIVVLVVFIGIAAAVLAAASRPPSPRVARLMQHTLTTSGQLGVRIAMLLVIFLAWFAGHLGLDVLLGAFTAGLVARLFLSGQDEETQEVTMAKLEGIGFGFLVPIFFVVSGIRFDLDALLSDPGALLLIPVALLLFLLIRGVPTYLALRGALAGRDRLGAGIYASTALPLVVVITSLGVQDGRLTEATAAALIGAGMLSVLLFPLTATRVRGISRPVAGDRWSDDSDAL